MIRRIRAIPPVFAGLRDQPLAAERGSIANPLSHERALCTTAAVRGEGASLPDPTHAAPHVERPGRDGRCPVKSEIMTPSRPTNARFQPGPQLIRHAER